ncbi:hypothetical protein KBZ21_41030, partial [Streptomyces sp. A73]|nr:hypothetical protein [Streptomyces sp. A73]
QWADGVEGAPASLFLTGNIGVGKTHTAWHTARRWLDNQYRGGLRPGRMVVVGARPGVGKTLFGTGLARAAAIKGGLPTLFK